MRLMVFLGFLACGGDSSTTTTAATDAAETPNTSVTPDKQPTVVNNSKSNTTVETKATTSIPSVEKADVTDENKGGTTNE